MEVIRAEDDPNYQLFAGEILTPEDFLLYYRLNNEVRRYSDLENDPHIGSVLQKRRFAPVSREVEVIPDGEREEDLYAADLCRHAIERFNFDEITENAMNAVLFGRFIQEIMWDDAEFNDRPVILPKAIEGRDVSRLIFARPKPNQNVAGVQMVRGFEARQLTMYNPWNGIPLPTNKLIIHSTGSKTGNPYGFGLGAKLFWMNKFKREVIKFWIVFLDKFSQPTPIGTYAEGKNKRELEEFLQRISRGAWAALPEGFKVEFLEAQRSGTLTGYLDFENWADAQTSKAVLGETLTTQHQDTGGSRAATQTHNSVRTEIAKADADLLSYTLKDMLLKPIVLFNVPGANVPNIWRKFDEKEDLTGRVGRDKTLFDMGFRLTLEKVIEIYGEGYVDSQEEERERQEQQAKNNPLAALPLDANGLPILPSPGEGDRLSDLPEMPPIYANSVTGIPVRLPQPANNSEGVRHAASKASPEFRALIYRVVKYAGLDIGIEYPPGAVRFKGKRHERKLKSAYGHIRNHVGNDGEALDVYVHPDLYANLDNAEYTHPTQALFIVKQVDKDGKFDEHKVMAGWGTIDDAEAAYLAEMPASFFGSIEPTSTEELSRYRKKVKEPAKDEDADSEGEGEGEDTATKATKPKSFADTQLGQALAGRPMTIATLSEVSHIPEEILREVYNRGQRAWATNGAATYTADQFAQARLLKFVLGGNTEDTDLIGFATPQNDAQQANLIKAVALSLIKTIYTDPISTFEILTHTTQEITGRLVDRRTKKGKSGERVCSWRILRDGDQIAAEHDILSDTVVSLEEGETAEVGSEVVQFVEPELDAKEPKELERYAIELRSINRALLAACYQETLIEDTIAFARARRTPGSPRNCKKGRSCGGSCIQATLTCRKPLEGQFRTHGEWLLNQGTPVAADAPAPAPAANPIAEPTPTPSAATSTTPATTATPEPEPQPAQRREKPWNDDDPYPTIITDDARGARDKQNDPFNDFMTRSEVEVTKDDGTTDRISVSTWGQKQLFYADPPGLSEDDPAFYRNAKSARAMELAFGVNSSYSVFGNTLDRRSAIAATRQAIRDIQGKTSQAPDGTIFTNHPVTADGRGDGRVKLYKRLGFGEPDRHGSMWGVVQGGQLRPISKEKLDELLHSGHSMKLTKRNDPRNQPTNQPTQPTE